MNANAQLLYDVLTGKKKLPKINLKNFTQANWTKEGYFVIEKRKEKNPNYCGTPGCIGGHARHLMGYTPESYYEDKVAEWLGLTPSIGLDLFYPGGSGVTDDADVIWGKIRAKRDPYGLRGAAGAKIAAQALKNACKLAFEQGQE